MNTIKSIFAAIKSGAMFVYKKLIGDTVTAVKKFIAKDESILTVSLPVLGQLSFTAGYVFSILLNLAVLLILLPFAQFSATFLTLAFAWEMFKTFALGYLAVTAIGILVDVAVTYMSNMYEAKARAATVVGFPAAA